MSAIAVVAALLLAGLAPALAGLQGPASPALREPYIPSYPRPPHAEHARLARWLVHELDWGVVSTASLHLDGAPFGNAVSYSDGPRGNSTGRLLFYLTSMDATAQDLAASPAATLTVCEAQLPGGCEGTDPEDPTCAKLALSGELRPVGEDGLEEARELLFARHAAMRGWPAGHAFRVYELALRTLRLLDWYGGAQNIAPADFLAASLGVEGGRQSLSLQLRLDFGSEKQ